ncbi:MAG: hypothetical protein VKK04_06505 [Synechococcales bacterium]|nr:hypothetical protein [Synechococcales bacterium]
MKQLIPYTLLCWMSFIGLTACDRVRSLPIPEPAPERAPESVPADPPENRPETTPEVTPPAASAQLWAADTGQPSWQTVWQLQPQGQWGLENLEQMTVLGDRFPSYFRVHYPARSASPTVARTQGVPLGGTQFYASLGLPSQEALRLRYFVRFSENFDFMKGGKLPGLYGGAGNSGGDIPDGTDGFSTRLMWRQRGEGEVYAYLPTSIDHGTSIGRTGWRFQPGVWHQIEQEVVLNQPGEANGRIRLWLDGVMVVDQGGLTFRTVETLQINGILFSTFFGGGDASWATPADVFVDFADFAVYSGDR